MSDDSRRSAPPWALWLAALSVALFSAWLKIGMSTAMPAFRPADDQGYFHVESALQYRYAKLLAAGQEAPAIDTKAEYPEGLRVGRDVSLLMERATALSWKLSGGGDPRGFHRFVIAWVAGVSSLSVLALFGLGLSLGAPAGLALACAGAFGVSWSAVSSAAGAYGFQDFALPLLLVSLAGLALVLTREGRTARAGGVLAALALAPALDAWHFSRFFLLSVWVALAYAAWKTRNDDASRRRILNGVVWLLVGGLVAGVCSGVLRQTNFLAAPEFMIGGALALTLWLGPRGAALGAAVTLGGFLFSRGAEWGAYGHVWGLLVDKIRFGLTKPQDAGRLSRDARLLWTGPFDSPDAGFAVFSLLPLVLLAAPRLWPDRSAERDAAGEACDGLLVLYSAGALLVSRLMPLFAFFLALAPLRRSASRLAPRWVLALALSVAGCEALKTLAPASPLNPFMGLAASLTRPDARPGYSSRSEREVLGWLRDHGEGRPVLADFGLSASILAYTPSPVLLQPKFESALTRAKTAEYLAALYSDEDGFDAFCRKYGAKLFVYSASDLLDETKDGSRYMADAPPPRGATAAVLFQFHPESLRRFRLVFEDQDYRIFEEGLPGTPARADGVYDIARYHPQYAADGRLVLDVAGVLARRDQARMGMMLAAILERMGRRQEADQAFQRARALWPLDHPR